MFSNETNSSGRAHPGLDFEGWKTRFYKRLKTDIEARESRDFLLKLSCLAGIVDKCLFQLSSGREDAAQLLSWEIVHKIHNRQRVLAIRKAIEHILSISDNVPDQFKQNCGMPVVLYPKRRSRWTPSLISGISIL